MYEVNLRIGRIGAVVDRNWLVVRKRVTRARLLPVKMRTDRNSRQALQEAVREAAATKAVAGPSAARGQDFLYGDDGLTA